MAFARRTGWIQRENALAIAVRSRRASGAPLLDLTTSNPTAVDLPYDRAEILRAIALPGALDYRPEPLGLITAREAIAKYYAQRGIEVSPSQVVLTASTSEAYSFLLRLLCDPGDAVRVPEPSYPLFDYLLQLADVTPLPYLLAYDGAWHLDRDSLRSGPPARAALVVSPNNPTGSCFDRDDREVLVEEAVSRDWAIVSDEVFADYAAGGHRRASWIGEDRALIFSLNGLSKIAGLPQLKLGWIVVSGPPDRVAEALQRLEIIADTFLSVGTPVQLALPELLDLAEPWQARLRERLAENRAGLAAKLSGTALGVRRSEGGWSAIVDVPRIADEEHWALELLERDGVLVHPGFFFEIAGGGSLVLSLLAPPGVFAEGLDRLLVRAAKLGA